MGFENVKGFLKGGIRTWINSGNDIDKIESITADEFASRVKTGKGKVIDVRKPSEYDNGHVKGAKNFSLAELENELQNIPKDVTCLIHCQGGYRSMIASSMLMAKGINNFVNVYGGYSKIKETDVPIVVPASA